MQRFPALLVRVVDGDTIIVDLHLGLGVWLKGRRCRLARINAPEMSTPQGPIARTYLDHMLQTTTLPMTVEASKDDNYGRLLIELYSGNANVNETMVKAGMAVSVSYLEEDNDGY